VKLMVSCILEEYVGIEVLINLWSWGIKLKNVRIEYGKTRRES